MSDTTDVPAEARIDWSSARTAVVHDDELLFEVVDAFLTEFDQTCQLLTESLKLGDASSASRAAHTLKSNLRTFGTPVASTMQRIEQSARSGLLEPMIPLWRDTRPLVECVARQLRDWRIATEPSELT